MIDFNWKISVTNRYSKVTQQGLIKVNRYLRLSEAKLRGHLSRKEYSEFYSHAMQLLNRSFSMRLLAISKNYSKYAGYSQAQIDRAIRLSFNDKVLTFPSYRMYIPKPNGELRPLSVPQLCVRLYVQVIMLVLNLLIAEVISPRQFGFTPGRSIYGCWLEVLRSLITTPKARVFEFDFSKFFDKLDHSYLLRASSDLLKLNPDFEALIGRLVTVPFRDKGKRIQPNKVGVPQGLPISPMLANLCTDKAVLKRLNNVFVYADDGLLIASADKFDAKVEKFRGLLKESCSGIEISESKSKVSDFPAIGFSLKFLGITLTREGFSLATKSGRTERISTFSWKRVFSEERLLKVVEPIRSCFCVVKDSDSTVNNKATNQFSQAMINSVEDDLNSWNHEASVSVASRKRVVSRNRVSTKLGQSSARSYNGNSTSNLISSDVPTSAVSTVSSDCTGTTGGSISSSSRRNLTRAAFFNNIFVSRELGML